MGLIKTAMMSGAAIYGVNQLAKTAQSRNNNAPPPRYDYSDRNCDSRHVQPMEFRDPESRGQRCVNAQGVQGTQRSNEWEPRQTLHLTDQRSFDQQPYYMQEGHNDLPQYYYASNVRSPSASAQNHWNQRQQQGFVERESMDDSRGPQSGNGGRADMINALAQQAMSMGLVGGKNGKKDKDSNGDLLGSLIRK
jgi:hypothetical protein